jgi:hypothetical protein
MKETLRSQHLAIRYLLPLDFHETFDRLVDLLEHLETKGGVEELMAIPRSNTIVCYDEEGNAPKSLIDAVLVKLKPVIMQELAGIKSQISSLKDDALTSSRLAEILRTDTPASSAGPILSTATQSAEQKENDLVRRKLLSLIKGTIIEEREDMQTTFAAEDLKKPTIATLLGSSDPNNASSRALQTHGTASASASAPPTPSTGARKSTAGAGTGVGGDSSTAAAAPGAAQSYVDSQVAQLQAQLTAMTTRYEAARDATENGMSVFSVKLQQLEYASQALLEKEAELQDARKKDTEALKILQRRLAAVSIDNVS